MGTTNQDQYAFQTSEGGWRVVGTRVSLDSVIHLFLDGSSAEEIVSQFPSLSLEQVYGAIAFYLHRREEIDRYLAAQAQQREELTRQQSAKSDPLIDRIRRKRPATATPRKSA